MDSRRNKDSQCEGPYINRTPTSRDTENQTPTTIQRVEIYSTKASAELKRER